MTTSSEHMANIWITSTFKQTNDLIHITTPCSACQRILIQLLAEPILRLEKSCMIYVHNICMQTHAYVTMSVYRQHMQIYFVNDTLIHDGSKPGASARLDVGMGRVVSMCS